MSEKPSDNCDSCKKDYTFDPEHEDVVCIFIQHPNCNYVWAHCPHCQAHNRIYLKPDDLVWILQAVKLPIEVQTTASQETQDEARAVCAGTELPHPPRDWLRQLHDDLREFGGEA